MTAPLIIPKIPIEECLRATDLLCYLTNLLKDDTQHITWVLVFLGWVLSIIIAVVQYKKTDERLKIPVITSGSEN